MRTGAVETCFPELVAEGIRPDVVIVDPPRAGLHKHVANTLCEHPSEHLIYVSCQPTTLARDVAHLTENAFAVTDVIPVDMFPHTPHLEVIARLEPKSP